MGMQDVGMCTHSILPALTRRGSGRSEPRLPALPYALRGDGEPRPLALPPAPCRNNRKGAVVAKERKDAQIHLRISERDAALMRERAQAAGLDLSAYVRRCALAGGAPAPAADARELRPIYAELRRCGNNVNQIARAFNTYGIGGVPAADVARAVAELERAAQAVADAMEAARP